MKLLLDAGANKDEIDEVSSTVDHYHMWCVLRLFVRNTILCVCHFAINIHIKNGMTLLHYAGSGGHLQAIKLLLDVGVGRDAKDKVMLTRTIYLSEVHALSISLSQTQTHCVYVCGIA
jgi:ankyrin repeat protein